MRTTTIESPLAQGFCRGVHPDFDTATRESMSVKPPPPSIAELAARYQVSERTLYRWKRAGVNLADPLAIAEHIALKSNSAAAVHAALKTIKQP